MSEGPAWEVCPVLRVTDVRAAVEYYRRRLGFSCADDSILDGVGAEGAVYGIVRRGHIAVHLGRRRTGHELDPGAEPNALGAYFQVPDVDALYEEFRSRGADLVREPLDEPYGMRDFAVRDLDGYHLAFGQPL